VNTGGDTYNVQGAHTLSATSLDRISNAFGVIWDPDRSCRIDDGTHPHLCIFKAVGAFMGTDGMPVTISGTNRTDLRDGSAQTEGYRENDGTFKTAKLRKDRQHMLAISESKARARAFRKAIGLKSMTVDDIRRPWVVFKVQLTGESDDWHTQRKFERIIFQNALGARLGLFGRPQAQLPAGPITVQALPAADLDADDDFEDDEVPELVAPCKTEPNALPSPHREPEEARQSEPSKPSQPSPITSSKTWPFPAKRDGSPEKGIALTEVSTHHLEWLVAYSTQKAKDGGPYAHSNSEMAQEAQRIIDSRKEPIGDGYDARGMDPDKF